ncbi:hypothetical protein PCASD_03883 [Puccinia coronata f. sp. avenae]|uniref:Uncharacterized protein n=1 Tax=Puccinia coronata f. sp. avenae TaxID=200324 RepID=A0A2N5V2L7_9BASI|nr:hypothetical protein PCASD_03883 [Puccinia coronata f. sp. avenae]
MVDNPNAAGGCSHLEAVAWPLDKYNIEYISNNHTHQLFFQVAKGQTLFRLKARL